MTSNTEWTGHATEKHQERGRRVVDRIRTETETNGTEEIRSAKATTETANCDFGDRVLVPAGQTRARGAERDKTDGPGLGRDMRRARNQLRKMAEE